MEVEAVFGGCNRSTSGLDFKDSVIAYTSGRAVMIFDTYSHKFVNVLRSHTDRVNCVRILDRSCLVSGSSDKTVKVWGQDGCKASFTLDASVVSIAISGNRVAAADISGAIAVLRITDSGLNLELKFKIKKSLPESISLNPEGILAIGSCDASIYIYSISGSSSELNTVLTGHKKTISALDFNDRGDLLASSSLDTTIRVWRLYQTIPEDLLEREGHFPLLRLGQSFKVDALLTSHTAAVSSVRWVGDRLVSASHDCSVIVWETDRRSGVWLPMIVLGQLGGCRHTFYAAVGSDSDIIANSYNGTIFHWTRTEADWKLTPAISGHVGPVTDVAVGEGFIVTVSNDQTARLFSQCQGNWQELSRPLVHGFDLNCVALTPFNLITGGDEKVLRLFEPSSVTSDILNKFTGSHLEGQRGGSVQALGLTNKPSEAPIATPTDPPNEDFLSTSTLWPEVFKLYGHGYEVSAIAVHHPILASACNARTSEEADIIIWDITERRKASSISCHSLTVTHLEFSPSGLQLLSVSRARSWGLHTHSSDGWTTVHLASAHERMIYDCCWLDDQVFMTTSRDKTAKLWRTDNSLVTTLKFKLPVTAGAFLSPTSVLLGLEDGSLVTHSLSASESSSVKLHSDSITRIRLDSGHVYVTSSDHTAAVLSRPLS